MSQEKVEKRKAQKANRKQISQSKRTKGRVATFVVAVICLAVVIWIGYSIYGKNTSTQEADLSRTPVNSAPIYDYMYGGGDQLTSEDIDALNEHDHDHDEDAAETTEEAATADTTEEKPAEEKPAEETPAEAPEEAPAE